VNRESVEHLANWAPTPLKPTQSSLTGDCSLGLPCRDWAEHTRPGIYLNSPAIAYRFLHTEGVEEKQRYSVGIKITDIQNLPASKKLKPPDSTLPPASVARIPGLRAGNCSKRPAAGSKPWLSPFSSSRGIFRRMQDGAAQKTGSGRKYPSPSHESPLQK